MVSVKTLGWMNRQKEYEHQMDGPWYRSYKLEAEFIEKILGM